MKCLLTTACRRTRAKPAPLMPNDRQRKRGHREDSRLRDRIAHRCRRRSRHHRALWPRLDRRTLRHFRCVLRHRHGPSRLWSRPDFGGIGFPRAKDAPRFGLPHPDRWDNDGSDGPGGNRARSRHHRVVVATGIRRRPSHGNSSAGPRRLRRIRLRSHSNKRFQRTAVNWCNEGGAAVRR